MTDAGSDPVVRDLRGEISEVDRAIVAAVNARLALVTRLKRHKESRGLPFVDPERERQLVEELARINAGPLSDEGLRSLCLALLELTKREVAHDSETPGSE